MPKTPDPRSGPGRPRLPAKESRSVSLLVRLHPDERETFEKAAKRAKLTLSAWVRDTLLAASGGR